MKCRECGSENLEVKNAKGSTFQHLCLEQVELKFDCYLLTCNNCNNYTLRPHDSTLLDRALNLTVATDFKEMMNLAVNE